jgi:hypothetical protein
MFQMDSHTFRPDRSFDSALEAYEFIFTQYAMREPETVWLPNTSSGLVAPFKVPRYLFRGESGTFPTTLAGIQRPQSYSLSDGRRLAHPDLKAVWRLGDILVKRLSDSDYELDVNSALGLVQHYGIPTPMIDFTKALQTAFAFAGARGKSVGRVCVLSAAQFLRGGRRGGFGLVDMSAHKWAHRAQRQEAFGLVMLNRIDDLKSDALREALSLTWYEFNISDGDRVMLEKEFARLTLISDDPSAGFLRYHVNEYVEAFGKFQPIVADWLAEKLPVAPHCYLVKGVDGDHMVVNHRGFEALPSFNIDMERERSRRYWSLDFPDDLSQDRIPALKWPAIGGIVADPRTYHSGL